MANLTVKDSTGTTKYLSASGAGTDGDPQILKHEVSNFPATQPVSGSVDISNFPVTQPVSGIITIDNTVDTLTGPQKQLLQRKLDTVGDGLGSTNMNVDGSSVIVPFKLKPGPTQVFRVSAWRLIIEDSATFDVGGWGNNGGTPLTNGLLMRILNNGVPYDMQLSIKSHADVAVIADSFDHYAFGSGNNFVIARRSFLNTGQYIRLDGATGDELIMYVRDDLTFLVRQEIFCTGYIEE
jgi:hypothetical protein